MKRARAALVAGLLLAACGGSHPNAADKAFVADMTPHHALGVRMAALALQRAEDVRVREFGFTMGRYQQAEFTQLNRLATQWHAAPSGHIHGMLTADEELALATLEGDAFDQAWLTQMIRHHEGAVDMAEAESTRGQDQQATSIASAVVTVQRKEIAQMKAALADLTR